MMKVLKFILVSLTILLVTTVWLSSNVEAWSWGDSSKVEGREPVEQDAKMLNIGLSSGEARLRYRFHRRS